MSTQNPLSASLGAASRTTSLSPGETHSTRQSAASSHSLAYSYQTAAVSAFLTKQGTKNAGMFKYVHPHLNNAFEPDPIHRIVPPAERIPMSQLKPRASRSSLAVALHLLEALAPALRYAQHHTHPTEEWSHSLESDRRSPASSPSSTTSASRRASPLSVS